jgi:hypothetical protein
MTSQHAQVGKRGRTMREEGSPKRIWREAVVNGLRFHQVWSRL